MPWKSYKVRLKISCTRMYIIRRSDVSHRQPPGTTSWLFRTRTASGNEGVCSLSLVTVPYVVKVLDKLIWSCTVRPQLVPTLRLGPCCDGTTLLTGEKAHRQSNRNLETLIPLQNMITRGLVVDKGNKTQSTYQFSYVCTITPKVCRLVWQGASDTAPASMPWYPVLAQAGRFSPCALT